MKDICYSLIISICCYTVSYAQIGIGTDSPSAELEISAEDSSMPALELNPQTAPSGSVTGQIAMIGDVLYMYDATRGKWLSIESTTLQYGRSFRTGKPPFGRPDYVVSDSKLDDTYVMCGGDVEHGNTGPKMPRNGTIISLDIKAGSGKSDKKFQIRINGSNAGNSGTPSLDASERLTNYVFNRTIYNIDFNAGDYVQIWIHGDGGAIYDVGVVMEVKWRK